MNVLDKKSGRTDNSSYNPRLDLPIPLIVLEKTERARKTLEKYPPAVNLHRK